MIVVMKTSLGDIEVELFEEEAPLSVANFLSYVDEGFYKETIFHRVINNFMIQGGGFTEDMKQKEVKAPIKNEATNGKKNVKGSLAYARTAVVDSATSQFFINVKDNDFLDHQNTSDQGFGYCVFGQVVSGIEVVEKIKVVATGSAGPYQDVPAEPIKILDVVRKDG